MAYKRKYRKGRQIASLDELEKQEFIYCRHQILHAGWFTSWPVRLAKKELDSGVIYTAEKIEEDEANAAHN